MFDIVDLLRMPWDDGFAIHQPRKISLDAAAEIERLRAALARACAGEADIAKKEPCALPLEEQNDHE
jgi:hypothetical protein